MNGQRLRQGTFFQKDGGVHGDQGWHEMGGESGEDDLRRRRAVLLLQGAGGMGGYWCRLHVYETTDSKKYKGWTD